MEDLPRVAALDAAAFGNLAYPPFFFRQALDSGAILRVVEQGGVLAGYALALLAAGDRVGWILSMAVDERHRGRGIAGALVDDVLRELSARGATDVRLTVEPDNAPARRLYAKRGFVQVADEPDYFAPGDRRLVLARPL